MVKANLNRRKIGNKQRGAMIMDNLVAVGFISMLVIGIVASIPTLSHKMNVMKFQSQINDITTASIQWKKQRPNFTGLTMAKLCEYELVAVSLCDGGGGPGIGVNAFGGDFTLTPNKASFALKATLPNLTGETGRQLDLADTMAPMTKLQCASADDCDSLVQSSDALEMKF